MNKEKLINTAQSIMDNKSCNKVDCNKCPMFDEHANTGYLCKSRNKLIESGVAFSIDDVLSARISDAKRFMVENKKLTEPEPESPRKITKREHLLNRVKQIEAHKIEFNKIADRDIEKLEKTLSCDGCYINDEGKYILSKSNLYAFESAVIAKFTNEMESNHEK